MLQDLLHSQPSRMKRRPVALRLWLLPELPLSSHYLPMLSSAVNSGMYLAAMSAMGTRGLPHFSRAAAIGQESSRCRRKSTWASLHHSSCERQLTARTGRSV